MRYLKNFKESDKSDYYTTDVIGDQKYIDISEQSIDYIKTLFPGIIKSKQFTDESEYRYETDLRSAKNGEFICVKIYKKRNGKWDGNFVMYIMELEDEYFTVYLARHVENKDGPTIYKCDQIDGVRELIKDKVIK